MITQENATMLYSGIKGNFSIGNFVISPSFAPGYYESGKGKDLGSYLEFKSQINFGWNFGDKSNLDYLIVIYLMQILEKEILVLTI